MKYKKIDLGYIKDIEVRNNISSFVERVVNFNSDIISSKFFNPYEVKLIENHVDFYNSYFYAYGGNDYSERKVCVLSKYDLLESYKSYISVLHADVKNTDLSHRDVLGALMSLGIERSTVGDISIGDASIEIAALPEIASYISLELKKIRNTNVNFTIKDEPNMFLKKINYKEKIGVISSARIDNLVAAMAGVSRSEAKNLVLQGKVKVDFRKEDSPSYEVKENEMVSIAKSGRYVLDSFLGKTRKDKYRIKYLEVV